VSIAGDRGRVEALVLAHDVARGFQEGAEGLGRCRAAEAGLGFRAMSFWSGTKVGFAQYAGFRGRDPGGLPFRHTANGLACRRWSSITLATASLRACIACCVRVVLGTFFMVQIAVATLHRARVADGSLA